MKNIYILLFLLSAFSIETNAQDAEFFNLEWFTPEGEDTTILLLTKTGYDNLIIPKQLDTLSNFFIGLKSNDNLFKLQIDSLKDCQFCGTGGGGGIVENWLQNDLYNVDSLQANTIRSLNGFHAGSDKRIKNIIGLSNSYLDLKTLQQIEIVNYKLKYVENPILQKKVIAQQIKEVFPQAVSIHSLILPNGEEIKDFHSVDYEAISMLGISATKELSFQVEAMKSHYRHCFSILWLIITILFASTLLLLKKQFWDT